MARKKSAQNILVWVLMALLVVGLAGFGIDGFLTQTVRSIGQVGDREISTDDYARALQQEIRAIEEELGESVPFRELQAMGLDSQVRAQLVTRAALEHEAGRIGVSAGDASVQRTITGISAFQGPGGSFDAETYRFALENAGQTPSEFEAQVRRDSARGILQSATVGGVETPEPMRQALLDYYASRHDFALFTLSEEDLDTAVAEPDAEAVDAYYDDNQDRFTAPETRSITYAWLTPEMVLDTIEIDQEALRQLYDSRRADYVQPERRLVERLVFPDTEAASAAMTRLEAGEVSFEDLVEERGLSLDDTDMGDVTRERLDEAGDAVFDLDEPGAVTGPHPSPVGPALFRMNAILSAQETPLEEVEDELRTELAADRARRQIADAHDTFEDLLAGGATLEDLADETDMELGQIEWSEGSSDGIAAYEEFREAAARVDEDDYPEIRPLADGGVFALRLDEVTPPAPRPLDEVRAEAEAGARAEAVNEALRARADSLSGDLAEQGVDAFADETGLPVDGFEQVTRNDSLPDLPGTLLDAVFDAEPGDPVVHVSEERAYLAVVTDRRAPDPEDEQTRRLVQAIDEQIGGAVAQDVYEYFARAVEQEAGISFNQAAIDAVHTNFP
ncbi:MAG: peptidyl-prolyl cis-trans isomerase D [Rhodobacteraceae bacterium HLUCCA12]|nr:MAG: peptidyl-prolyl cis-trans isomerase D [Rhodobacteraceae bacterium HLUCCA12]